MIYRAILTLLILTTINYGNCETRAAVAKLIAGTINGTIYFTETSEGIHVTGTITGLKAGLYGFHVHEIGDISTCDAAGAHFNPAGNTHGGRDHAVRHVGDLGNVEFVGGDEAVANLNFVDNVIALSGVNNILGRTLILHEQEDDLGLGGHETSLTTGNAGARIVCGLILEYTADNSSTSIAASITVFVLTTVFAYIS